MFERSIVNAHNTQNFRLPGSISGHRPKAAKTTRLAKVAPFRQ
ncbi:MAG: hypothetical protein ACP5OH_05220 [Nitrososphaerota archaeon]